MQHCVQIATPWQGQSTGGLWAFDLPGHPSRLLYFGFGSLLLVIVVSSYPVMTGSVGGPSGPHLVYRFVALYFDLQFHPHTAVEY